MEAMIEAKKSYKALQQSRQEMLKPCTGSSGNGENRTTEHIKKLESVDLDD